MLNVSSSPAGILDTSAARLLFDAAFVYRSELVWFEEIGNEAKSAHPFPPQPGQ